MLLQTQSGGAVKPRRFMCNLAARCSSYKLLVSAATAGMSTTTAATAGMSTTATI
jgi:hypothetical protein